MATGTIASDFPVAATLKHPGNMKAQGTDQIKRGGRIIYNDGRPGHVNVLATVLSVDADGMTVLFDDRADTNYIACSDRRWMDFIDVAPERS